MKTFVWTGAGLAVMLAAGVAVAQMPPADGMRPMAGDKPGEEMGPHGHGGMREMMRHMPPPSKAAHFRFRKGDTMVDIKCADDEPTKACVEAGSALLDKLAAAGK